MIETLNRSTHTIPNYPTKIIQFGESKCLGAFVNWQIDLLNESTDFNSGVTIRPINAKYFKLDEQGTLYTALIQGLNEEDTNLNQQGNLAEELTRLLILIKSDGIRKTLDNEFLLN
jgi:tagaturonate reductase